MGNVYIDLTTLSSWRGQPVGISRCQLEYARFALNNIPNVRFTLFDPARRRHCNLKTEPAKQIIEQTLKIDMTMMPDLNAHRHHFVDKVPLRLRPLYWWITKPRRRLIAALERLRISGGDGRFGVFAARYQERLIRDSERRRYFLADGSRINCAEFSDLAGDAVEYQPDDITLAIQSDWVHTDIASIAQLKAKIGWRHVILCHDIIPIQFPHWFAQSDVDGFKTYYDRALTMADRVMFTSACTGKEVREYCVSQGIPIRDSAVVPMGSDIVGKQSSSAKLRMPIETQKFALFVSTIEPRKNHRLLVDAWRALANAGVVGKSGFKLVFVGRPGWDMGSFYQDIATDPLLKDTVLHLDNVDDDELSRLYQNAGFCLYPPKFEGFGLPIIEALANGKPLLVSNAGPMAEIAGDFAIALDPEDTEGWQKAMQRWIENPGEREEWSAKIRSGYVPMTWEASAKMFFEKACAPFHRPAS